MTQRWPSGHEGRGRPLRHPDDGLIGPCSLLDRRRAGDQRHCPRLRRPSISRRTPWTGTRTSTSRSTSCARRRRSAWAGSTSARTWVDPGLTGVDAARIFEELAKGCPSIAAYISIHNMVDLDDRQVRQRRAAPRSGCPGCPRWISWAATASPSPAPARMRRRLSTRAVRDGDDYVLNGVKQFISGAGTVGCVRRDGPHRRARAAGISAFIVPQGSPGLSFGAERDEDGLERAAHPSGDLRGRAGAGGATCSAPRASGFRIAMARPQRRPANIAACSVGGAQAALEQGRRVPGGPEGVRFAADRLAGAAVPARRHAHRTGSGPDAAVAGRGRARGRRARRRRTVRDGQALRHRHRVRRSPTRRCSCTAATATWPSTASRRSSATCGCTRSSRAPTRSCGWSSPAAWSEISGTAG